MDWSLYWTLLLQIVIAIIVLLIPLKMLFANVFRGIVGGSTKILYENIKAAASHLPKKGPTP